MEGLSLADLKRIVDFSCNNHHNPEKVKVIVTLNNSNIGPRAGSSVVAAYLGFDWEENQFRLDVEDKIVRKEN